MRATASALLFLLPLAGAAAPRHRVTFRCDAGSWKLFDDRTGHIAPYTVGGDGVVEIQGRDKDDDWLTLDLRDPGACAPLPDVRFDGGVGGWDGMSVVGGGDSRYLPGPQPGGGRIRIGSSTVWFSNLEPIDHDHVGGDGAAQLTAPAVVTVENGSDSATGTHPAIRISGTSAGVPFETLALWNVRQLFVVINQSPGQISSVTVNSLDGAAAHVTSFVIEGVTNFTENVVHGDLDVQGPVSLPGSVTLMGDFVYESGNGKITTPVLSVKSGVQVSLGMPNAVGAFGATAGDLGVYFTNDGSTRIGGITSGGPVTLKTTNGTLDLAGPIVTPSTLTIKGPTTVKARHGGDANGDTKTDVSDVFYLINFLFAGGPALY